MPDHRATRRQFLALCGGTGLAGIAGCTAPFGAAQETSEPPSESSPTPDTQTTATATTSTTPREDEATPNPDETPSETSESVYTDVYRETIDSVVLVDTGQGQGTGFVIDDTHLVTNAHVVGRASTTQLRFNQGDWSRGTVTGTDPHSDLAVIQAEWVPESATPLPFLDAPPTVGQEVVAIGNPFNLDGSVTTGIVSGTDRLIPAPTGFQIPDAIQTDAAVNPGNSGGPLMSLDSRVLGVVSSKRGDNIAFGISAALTQRVISELKSTGEYTHAYLGVQFGTVTPAVARANDLAEPRGIIVVQTVPEGPADGVLQASEPRLRDGGRVPVGGDVLLAIDGTPVSTVEDVASYLSLQGRPGEESPLRVYRDGRTRTVTMTLGERPARTLEETIR